MRYFLIFLFAMSALCASDFLASGPTGEIVIKNIPELIVVESELHEKSHLPALSSAHRKCSRYLATVDSPLRYPFLLQFPDWDTKKRETSIFFQMLLNKHLALRDPKESGMRIRATPAMTVVSLAYRGAYTLEKWEEAVQELRDHLKKINTPASGPPRHLLYSNPDWTPEFLRLSEAQIPIPANFQSP